MLLGWPSSPEKGWRRRFKLVPGHHILNKYVTVILSFCSFVSNFNLGLPAFASGHDGPDNVPAGGMP